MAQVPPLRARIDRLTKDATTLMDPSPGIDREYPSLDLAYEQGVRSYAEVASRLDAVHSRLDSIQSVVVTLTLAVPTVALAANGDTNFTSGWVIAAIALAVVTVILGLSARAWSGLILVDPGDLHEKWLHLPPAEFKREALYSAQKHFDATSRTAT
ncbi:MAG: hypothetical protein OXI03_09275, partial [Chloroflexota bacterium]|nr:hypothetical protein [Chloroflexota bacterium]